jgi:hypothetical protein
MVIIGFGDYKNYRIQEIPNDFLDLLSQSYKLSHSAHNESSSMALRATIAIHEEIQRRATGGAIWKRHPTRKELAIQLVNSGFRQASKEHHPDRPGGNTETQTILSETRDHLLNSCSKIAEPELDDAFVIPDPNGHSWTEIADDDIPF